MISTVLLNLIYISVIQKEIFFCLKLGEIMLKLRKERENKFTKTGKNVYIVLKTSLLRTYRNID